MEKMTKASRKSPVPSFFDQKDKEKAAAYFAKHGTATIEELEYSQKKRAGSTTASSTPSTGTILSPARTIPDPSIPLAKELEDTLRSVEVLFKDAQQGGYGMALSDSLAEVVRKRHEINSFFGNSASTSTSTPRSLSQKLLTGMTKKSSARTWHDCGQCLKSALRYVSKQSGGMEHADFMQTAEKEDMSAVFEGIGWDKFCKKSEREKRRTAQSQAYSCTVGENAVTQDTWLGCFDHKVLRDFVRSDPNRFNNMLDENGKNSLL